MAPLSPRLNGNPVPPSPRSSSGGQRPSIMKRNSSQGIMRTTIRSPGSELDSQPLRHAVRPKNHARVVLPRNHSSGRNLAKLARQVAAAAGDGNGNGTRPHTRTRSHEGDTEIRLPGSLDESEARPSTLRRNLTSSNLPRNPSHTKLKKNHSHGHLQRLGSGRDLVVPLSSNKHQQRVPLSPALRGKSKRPKSLDLGLEKDLHEREVELLQAQQEERRDGPKRVGFNIGADDEDAEGLLPNMEGSGLDEGEWTEESASVSPYSTRANTANNSRRASVQQHDRPPDKSSLSQVSNIAQPADEEERWQQRQQQQQQQQPLRDVETARELTNSSGLSTADDHQHDVVTETMMHPAPQATQPAVTRSPLHAAKEHPNPTTQLFLRQSSTQLPAPALVSHVTATDDGRILRESPSASLRSGTTATIGADEESDELVSRFVPTSTSNGSGTTTNMQNTPKSGSFVAPHEVGDDTHHAHGRDRLGFGIGPVSPGSTVSGSSGAATPAHGRSRIELRMLQEKALADLETAAERGPVVPAHVYDRRNETLKSYLQLASLSQAGGSLPAGLNGPLSLGPEIFQGRFKAVNTELRVVQKFRDPLAESLSRLQAARGSKLGLARSQKADAGLRLSKSAVNLPVRGHARKESSNLSTSTTPPNESSSSTINNNSLDDGGSSAARSALTPSKSSLTIKPTRRVASRGVSFAGPDHLRKDVDQRNEESSSGLDELVAEMWDSVLA